MAIAGIGPAPAYKGRRLVHLRFVNATRVLERLNHEFATDSGPVAQGDLRKQLTAWGASTTHADDLKLALDCLRGCDVAVRRLQRLLESAAASLRRRLAGGEDDRADLCQQAQVKLLYGGARRARAYLWTYEGRASLRSWLRTALARLALAQVRRRRRTTSLDDVVHSFPSDPCSSNPELQLIGRRYAGPFQTAFDQSLTRLTPRDRLVLQYVLEDRMTAAEIGRQLAVHRVTVARWMRSIRQTVLHETRERLRETLRVEPAEVTALFELCGSELDLSSIRALRSERTTSD